MSQKRPQPKVDDIVAVEFLDHVEGSDDIETFIVYGRVAKISKQALTIDSWALSDARRDRDSDRHNITTFTILKRVIENIEILKREESR